MLKKIPFAGLLVSRSPLEGLVDHYNKIDECIEIINDAQECYITGGTCKDVEELADAVGVVEHQADKIKRRIRNHLPRRLFMAVDKTLFLNYTNKQDNILDSAQEALNWLAMRRVTIPTAYQRHLVDITDGVRQSTKLLGPALHATLDLINGRSIDRDGTKQAYCKVRSMRAHVRELATDLTREVYNSDMDFKDIYQLIHYVDCLNAMSHNASSCVDILRAMIAR
ncbi:MAG: DUF47 domain-containing protein [Desulfovibrionaceae bacterium]